MTRALTNRTGALSAPQLDYFLIDGSGSMADKWWESQAGLQGFLDVLRTEGVGSHGIVHVFDNHDMASIQRDAPLADWPEFTDAPLVSGWGMTPLYDAINLMCRELAALDPARCAITIVTDGDENGSKHTTAEQARALLDWCRAKGWQVTFLGADFNNSKQAQLLGANESNSIGVQKHKLLEAGKLLGQKRANNARYGNDINFSDDEKTVFGGYLTNGGGNNDAN
jgi:hypothetical protein